MPLGPTPSLTRRGLLGGLGAAAVLGLTVDRGAQATTGGTIGTGTAGTRGTAILAAAATRPAQHPAGGRRRPGPRRGGRLRSEDAAAPRCSTGSRPTACDSVRPTPPPPAGPSRYALFTGLHTGHALVKDNDEARKGFRPRDVTVGDVLQRAGYTTAIVGKWGLAPNRADSPSHPRRRGFDHFFGYLTQRQAHDYWPTYLWRNHRRVRYPENARRDATYAGDLITREALRFLDRVPAGTPFFLDVSYTTPHAPNAIPDATPYTRTGWPKGERNHAAQVTWTDKQVGVLLAGLAERGLADDTLVMVISDNGPHGEGDHYGHVGSHLPHEVGFFNSNGPLRGKKRSLHEGGIRIPMIVRLPPSLTTGTSPAPGTVVRTPVAVWDLLPTFAELAGGRIPRGIDGVSFAALLRGGRRRRDSRLYWQHRGDRLGEAVRFGPWKAVRYGGGRVELYRLDRDLDERHDVARRHRAVARRAARMMHHAVT